MLELLIYIISSGMTTKTAKRSTQVKDYYPKPQDQKERNTRSIKKLNTIKYRRKEWKM